MIATIEPMDQITIFRYDKNGWRYAVNSYNMTLVGDSKAGDNVNVSDENYRVGNIVIDLFKNSFGE